jgi:hypothetical protein
VEIWKPIVGYEGRYEVSNLGAIRSLNFRRTGKARLLTPSPDSYGYLSVRLCDGEGVRTRKSFGVHRLVALAFIGIRPEGLSINHIDGDKKNNVARNLEYISLRENSMHAIENGLCSHVRLDRGKAAEIRRLGISGITAREIARRFSVHPSTVERVLNGKTWLSSQ